jgi:hypothetical protein
MTEWAVFFGDTKSPYITRHVIVQADTEVEALEVAESRLRKTEFCHSTRMQPDWEGPAPLKR